MAIGAIPDPLTTALEGRGIFPAAALGRARAARQAPTATQAAGDLEGATRTIALICRD
jgi:hypothetical protein